MAFAPKVVRREARGCWRCTSFAPRVSMVRSPTETGGERRSIELQTEWIALREVAAAERRPIGLTDENVRGAALTIRSARLPVLPGCDIPLVVVTMPVSMPRRVGGGSKKRKPSCEQFSAVAQVLGFGSGRSPESRRRQHSAVASSSEMFKRERTRPRQLPRLMRPIRGHSAASRRIARCTLSRLARAVATMWPIVK
jgi:hypothetical protein